MNTLKNNDPGCGYRLLQQGEVILNTDQREYVDTPDDDFEWEGLEDTIPHLIGKKWLEDTPDLPFDLRIRRKLEAKDSPDPSKLIAAATAARKLLADMAMTGTLPDIGAWSCVQSQLADALRDYQGE